MHARKRGIGASDVRASERRRQEVTVQFYVAAGYLDLPATHKLALQKYADSADKRTRIGIPGLEALIVWCGCSRARVLEVTAELQELGLLMQIGGGHKGRRASFKVFPDAGDEKDSLAVRRGEQCPGADLFKGVPSIPGPDELEDRVLSRPKRKPRGGKPKTTDTTLKGPNGRTQSTSGEDDEAEGETTMEGSDLSDPEGASRVRGTGPFESPKGPTLVPIGSEDFVVGSEPSDPFGTNLPNSLTSQAADAAWGSDDSDSEVLFDVPAPEPPEAAPTQVLVGAYCDAVEAAGGIPTKSMRGAIGRHVKRLIREDHIDLPVLLVAVQRAGAAKARDVDRFLGDAQQTYGRSDTSRRAMFDAWARVAEQQPIHRQIGA